MIGSIYINVILFICTLFPHGDQEVVVYLHADQSCPTFIAVYDTADSFLNVEKAVLAFVLDASEQEIVLKLSKDLDHIAIAAYQDCNNNKNLDKNLLGVPKEPYAFSNAANAKWSTPEFEEAKVRIKDKSQISLNFDYWKNK